MNCVHKFAATLLLVALAFRAAGQQPDPIEILKKADAAAKAVTEVSYKASIRGEGTLHGKVPVVTGTLRAKAVPGTEVPKFVIEAIVLEPEVNEPTFRQYINEGTQFAMINKVVKSARQGDPPESVEKLLHRIQPVAGIWLHQFFHPAPFQKELQADRVQYKGTEQVEGVECDVIRVVYRNDSARESLWYIGRKDHLPHRKDGVAPGGAVVLTLSELDVRPEFDADTFAIRIPEDYRLRYVGLIPVGWKAPDWTLRTPDGKSVSLQSLRGQIVVLDFWATWCIPCKAAMPGIQKLHEKYKDKSVAIFGIVTKERGDPVEFMKKKGYTYGLLLDGDKVAEEYRVHSIPAFYVIGPDGKILYRSKGYDAEAKSKLGGIIEKALADMQ